MPRQKNYKDSGFPNPLKNKYNEDRNKHKNEK